MRLGGGAATGRPCSSIFPSDGGISPAIIFRSVDFPQPDGPSRLAKPPVATSSDTPVSAVRPVGKVLPTSRTDRAGAVLGGCAAARRCRATASLLDDIMDHFFRIQVFLQDAF